VLNDHCNRSWNKRTVDVKKTRLWSRNFHRTICDYCYWYFGSSSILCYCSFNIAL